MAQQRVNSKSERSQSRADSARPRRKKSATTGPAPETLAEVRRQRDEARQALAAAEHRIAELESRNEQAVNRIDWVIDSLHTLKDGKS